MQRDNQPQAAPKQAKNPTPATNVVPMFDEARRTLVRFYRIFGHAVFIILRPRSKAAADKNWQNITFAETKTPEYQNRLLEIIASGGTTGGIAAVMGPASNNLQTTDVDQDELDGIYLADNIFLADTTQTRGRRGRNFWFRIKPGTSFPNEQSNYKLKTAEGADYGEYRCGKGAYVMFFGLHPDTGEPYQFLCDKPVIEIEYRQLKWLGPAPGEENKENSFPEIVSGKMIQAVHLPLPPEIISGLLSRGEKGELAGGSKSFKTWALIQQGLSIAAGIDWWGFPTHVTNVLFLNLEIPQPFFEERIRLVADALGIKIPECFHVWHLRTAKLGDGGRWTRFLDVLKAKCAAIPNPYLMSDPIYKLLGGRNENAAGDVATLLEQLDDMIELVDGANFFGHHFTKGNQSLKDAIDCGAGSGVFSRDPDTILTMRSHEDKDCFAIELPGLRNHPPINSFVVQWDFPLFIRQNNLDPRALKQPGGQKKYDVMLLPKWLHDNELPTKRFQMLLKDQTGMSPATFYKMLAEAESQKLIAFDGQTETWERCKNQ